MFREVAIFSVISPENRLQNLLTVFFPGSSANFPTKKYIPFCYAISVKNILQSILCNIWLILPALPVCC
ncbi:MAG: hypothetical protein BWX92_03027 [Deltaproteobacteria bacterium ADurb.Bin135]|nr:MAG: hypothetical protein BWX92_03027 [Deltaproteobacteria bacterium ADurb.Bin135]